MSRRNRLTTDQFFVVNGPIFGESGGESASPAHQAVADANAKDAERRRRRPMRKELAAALRNGVASESDVEQLIKIVEGRLPRSPGRPPDDANALLARDFLVYIEYSKLRGRGHPRLFSLRKAGKPFGLSANSVETTITRIRKLLIK